MLLVNHYRLFDVVGIYFLGVGILMFMHCRLYVELNNDKHLQWVLGLFLISFMLILFKAYLAELTIVWLLAYYYFNQYYYAFEPTSE